MKEETTKTTICPKCGKAYKGAPALSREDNTTLICPECGTRESLEGVMPQEEIEKLIDALYHQNKSEK